MVESSENQVRMVPDPNPPQVEIFTDGACRGNPGPGGWGAVLRAGAHEREMFGYEPHTTNNRMEMMAALQALAALKRPSDVLITTDSQYLHKGLTEWLPGWKKRGWRTASRQPVKNADLWQDLEAEVARHTVRWAWVRGHSGHPENERADRLANRAIDEALGLAQPQGGRT